MQMDLYVPEPEEALAELKPLTDAVRDFLLEATDDVVAYFHRQGQTVDRTASTNMFRYELLRQLKAIAPLPTRTTKT